MLPNRAGRGTVVSVPAAILLLLAPGAQAQDVVDHALRVTLAPDAGRIVAEDRLTLPSPAPAAFSLHRSLSVVSPDASLVATRASGPYQHYRVTPRAGGRTVTLRYEGALPAGDDGTGIGRDNVYLDGEHAWFPRFDARLTVSLTVTLPEGWLSVSQGRREGRTWVERHPQEEIYLVAARFTEYRRATPSGEALVLLRRPDPDLADTYLRATGRYLDLYSRLIGPYPYAKFALVENNRETGFGMPSFTLLGPRVIRLPFIPHTSFPHEILHNWWGNGVYIDLSEGNWAEGLTSYLADHLFAERAGRGEEYRLSALLAYADYVTTERDFALQQFKARRGEVSQAVGYNKALMFFHMLRLRVGDRKFTAGLRRFYRTHRFEPARFSQLRTSMEAETGQDLAAFFEQWIARVGAPVLRLTDVRSEERSDGYHLRAVLAQTQDGPAYDLRVPIAIALEGREYAQEATIAMTGKRAALDLRLPARPLRVEADPRVDVFRRLDPAETPPSLAQLFAAQRPLFVLPAGAPAALRAGYENLAKQWSTRQEGAHIVVDEDLEALPDDRPVWLLGWENRFRDAIARELPEGSALTGEAAVLAGERVARAGHSLVAAIRPRAGSTRALIATDDPKALPGLARKLPHYDQYSYLVFAGDVPDNVRKGLFKTAHSPLVVTLVPGTPRAKLAPRPPLTAVLEDR